MGDFPESFFFCFQIKLTTGEKEVKATETLFDVLSEQMDFSSYLKYNWMKMRNAE